jgi:hypothetical protein
MFRYANSAVETASLNDKRISEWINKTFVQSLRNGLTLYVG